MNTSKQRNFVELFNSSVKYLIENSKFIFLNAIIVGTFFSIVSLIYSQYSSKLQESFLLIDSVNLIYNQIENLGINVILSILYICITSIFIFTFSEIKSERNNVLDITLIDVYKKIKSNFLSLFSLTIVLIVLFMVFFQILIKLNTDFEQIFGFSLKYVVYFILPFLMHFNFLIMFVAITEKLELTDAFKGAFKKMENPFRIYIKLIFICLIAFLIKYIVSRLVAILFLILPYNSFVYFTIIEPINYITPLLLYSFIAIYILNMSNNKEDNVENKILEMINEIK